MRSRQAITGRPAVGLRDLGSCPTLLHFSLKSRDDTKCKQFKKVFNTILCDCRSAAHRWTGLRFLTKITCLCAK